MSVFELSQSAVGFYIIVLYHPRVFLGHPDRNTPYFSFIMMILLIEFLGDVGIISSVLYNGEAKTDRL